MAAAVQREGCGHSVCYDKSTPHMKSSRKSGSLSWLLEASMLSAVCRSSYMWSFWYFNLARSSASTASCFFCVRVSIVQPPLSSLTFSWLAILSFFFVQDQIYHIFPKITNWLTQIAPNEKAFPKTYGLLLYIWPATIPAVFPIVCCRPIAVARR